MIYIPDNNLQVNEPSELSANILFFVK